MRGPVPSQRRRWPKLTADVACSRTVVAACFIILGGYTLFLQYRMAGQEALDFDSSSESSRDRKGITIRGIATARLDRSTTGEAIQLVRETHELTEQVAELARALEQKADLAKAEREMQKALRTRSKSRAHPAPVLSGGDDSAAGAVSVQAEADPEEPLSLQEADADPEEPLSSQEVARRRAAVVEAARHSWAGYAKYAWGADELKPLQQQGKNLFGGMGATIIDSLDTLWLMELREQFQEARDWVATELTFAVQKEVSVFETTIRILGGLLSAYEFSGDEVFLGKANELGRKLMLAFNTKTGVPFNLLHMVRLVGRNPTWTRRASTLSEFGTEQLEFAKLSQLTTMRVYTQKSEGVIKFLHDRYGHMGLLPIYVNPKSGELASQRVSMGAMGDSYYEYLLKMWILKGKKDEMYRGMWERAMDDMLARMLATSIDGLTYLAELEGKSKVPKMDHLVCFAPAMLALGAHSGAVGGAKGERYMQVAADLTYTCWQMYERQPTGLAPEFVRFGPRGMTNGAPHNLMRPETMEALFVMFRVTRDPKYREWSWRIFRSYEKHCKVEAGFTGLKNVAKLPAQQDDTMQSFWIAEMLKYLFLIFSDENLLSLDEWVLNTEAHPFKIIPP